MVPIHTMYYEGSETKCYGLQTEVSTSGGIAQADSSGSSMSGETGR